MKSVIIAFGILVLFVQVCICLTGVSVPIRYIPREEVINDRRRSFGTDGVSPKYIKSGGSWAIGIDLGSSSGLLYCNLDTGSFDLFVAPQSCSNCNPTPPTYYKPSAQATVVSCTSTTCGTDYNTRNSCNNQQNCQTSVTYGDKSGVVANVVKDRVGIPGLKAQILGYFGSIDRTIDSAIGQPFLSEGQSGLIGTAYGSGSSFPNGGRQGLFDYLANVNNVPNIFSLCINQNSPWMSFGENYYGKSNFFWTQTTFQPYYGFTMTNMLLNFNSTTQNGGGVSLGLDQTTLNLGRPFIDSGTTLIYFETSLFNAFYNGLTNACSRGINLVGFCNIPQSSNKNIFTAAQRLTQSQLNAYPTIQVAFNCIGQGAPCQTLNIPPTSWMRNANGDYWGAGVMSDDKLTIFGDLFMFNYHVVFDKTRNYIGFANPQTSCQLDGVFSNVSNPDPNPASSLKTPFSLVKDFIL